MKIAVFAVAALLSGCELQPTQPTVPTAAPTEDFASSVWRRLNAGVNRFAGLPVQSAVTVLGYPTGERVVMGDRVYYWESVSEVPGIGEGPNFRIWCRIEIGTAPDGTIKNTHYDGNAGGCAKYATVLTQH
jgi:hypothetical protein